MQTTIERDEVLIVDDELETLRTRNRWLSWLSGFLAVAVVVLGAWLILDDDGGGSTDLTAEQEQMLETVNVQLAAWNDGDGAAVASLMASENSYHDNGSTRVRVADGALEAYVNSLGPTFSVRSLSTDGEAAFVGNYVMTTDFIPKTSETPRPSIFKMTPDGTAVVWHYAP